MLVSVIVTAYNEAESIQACLECLTQQTLPNGSFEVVVVDNGSTDATPSLAAAFAGRLHLQVATYPRVSISAARNLGATLAHAPVYAFLDGDCLTPPTWLETALRRAPATGLWGAHYVVPEDATWVGRIWQTYQARMLEGPVPFLPGSALFIRAEAFTQLKGFDEHTETSEDVDFGSRARRLGMPVVAMPALAVVHEGTPRTLLGFYRQNRWHGKQVFRLFLKNLPSLENWHLVGLSLYTFVLFWALILAICFTLAGRSWLLPLVAFTLLLLPALLLAAKKTLVSGRPKDLPALSILYATYLLSRAAALTQPGSSRTPLTPTPLPLNENSSPRAEP